jgi:crossover junction endodeoxyribonuclease RusA
VNTYYRRGPKSTYLAPQGKKFRQLVSDIVCTEKKRIEGRLSVFLGLYSPTRRAYDIDNRVKAVLDALQHAGVYEDDEQIDRIEIVRRPVLKGGLCIAVIAEAGDEA